MWKHSGPGEKWKKSGGNRCNRGPLMVFIPPRKMKEANIRNRGKFSSDNVAFSGWLNWHRSFSSPPPGSENANTRKRRGRKRPRRVLAVVMAADQRVGESARMTQLVGGNWPDSSRFHRRRRGWRGNAKTGACNWLYGRELEYYFIQQTMITITRKKLT